MKFCLRYAKIMFYEINFISWLNQPFYSIAFSAIFCLVERDKNRNKVVLIKFETSITSPKNVFQFPRHLFIVFRFQM